MARPSLTGRHAKVRSMKKRPLLIFTGTVMGTVGVLSYVPLATNATPLSVISASPTLSSLATNPPADTKAASKTPASAGSISIRKIAGATIQTQFGPVQVQITVRGTRIIAARALQTPQGETSSMINRQAVPYLIQQTLVAQSANVQGVSGASYTSAGWARSLQSALSHI